MSDSISSPSPIGTDPTALSPHVLWRQVAGFVLCVSLLGIVFGAPLRTGHLGLVLSTICGALTLADAWKSGIYKHRDRKSFLNISPMGWGIAVALLFVVAYPCYILSRNRLRTVRGGNVLFWLLIVLGLLLIALIVLRLLGSELIDVPVPLNA